MPNTTNISFDRVEAESLLIALDLEGIAVSTGSACSSGTLEPSHVLKAMGLPSHRTQNSLRFSLGMFSTEEEVDRVVEVLPRLVEKLRGLTRKPVPRERRVDHEDAETRRTRRRRRRCLYVNVSCLRVFVAGCRLLRCESSSRCPAAWIRRWRPRCSPSRATTLSACRCSSTISRRGRPRSAAAARSTICTTRGASPRRIDIPHYIVNFEKQFDEQVVSNFVREYAPGRTPLPCAHCNSDLKFATLAERARGFGADAVATGHYARVERGDDGRPLPAAARRRRGEGSVVFPVLADAGPARARGLSGRRSAEGRGSRVRAAPRPAGRRQAGQPGDLLHPRQRLPLVRHAATCPKPRATAPSSMSDGRVLGTPRRHPPLHGRPAQGPRACRSPTGAPMYVLALRPAEQQVVVGPKASLEQTRLTASGVNWIAGEPRRSASASPRRSAIATRPRRPPCARSATPAPRSIFDAPQLAITPGQAVVFYDGDSVIGGGWID